MERKSKSKQRRNKGNREEREVHKLTFRINLILLLHLIVRCSFCLNLIDKDISKQQRADGAHIGVLVLRKSNLQIRYILINVYVIIM